MRKVWILIAISCVCIAIVFGFTEKAKDYTVPPTTSKKDSININAEAWATQTLQQMTLEEKIGQLFMADAYSCRSEKHFKVLANLVENHHIGGLIFMKGGPVRQAIMTNRLQALAKTKLLIGMDAEWGLGMQLDSVPSFPRQMTLGSANKPEQVYAMGKDIARQMKLLNVHLSFSPVVDLNTNKRNPIIGNRSFGDNSALVTSLSIAYMKGLQDHGIIANAKHFPGHGNVGKDSHISLPTLNKSFEELDSTDLVPYKKLIAEGLQSIMIGHLNIPKIDEQKNQAASVSKILIQDILKAKMGFKGLIFTDALNMRAVTKYHKPGELELKALKAGNDVLIFSEHIPEAISVIKKAVLTNDFPEAELNLKVQKILEAKHKAQLHMMQPIEINNLVAKLNIPKTDELLSQMYADAVVTKGNASLMLNPKDQVTFITLNSGNTSFFNRNVKALGNYPIEKVTLQNINKQTKQLSKLRNRKLVVAYFNINQGISGKVRTKQAYINLLEKLNKHNQITLIVFGSPYALPKFKAINNIVLMHEDNYFTQSLAPNLLFGNVQANTAAANTLSN
jgi:beta-glucosidase-like glycosyl hydrolase